MPKRRRRRSPDPWQKIVLGIETSRRVGWARYYDEAAHSRQLQLLADGLRERIETLVPEFLSLVDAVLYERNLEAFSQAYRVQVLLEDYLDGRRRPN